jgi:hypothetical protein
VSLQASQCCRPAARRPCVGCSSLLDSHRPRLRCTLYNSQDKLLVGAAVADTAKRESREELDHIDVVYEGVQAGRYEKIYQVTIIKLIFIKVWSVKKSFAPRHDSIGGFLPSVWRSSHDQIQKGNLHSR